jgi:hypothetical protein
MVEYIPRIWLAGRKNEAEARLNTGKAKKVEESC